MFGCITRQGGTSHGTLGHFCPAPKENPLPLRDVEKSSSKRLDAPSVDYRVNTTAEVNQRKGDIPRKVKFIRSTIHTLNHQQVDDKKWNPQN